MRYGTSVSPGVNAPAPHVAVGRRVATWERRELFFQPPPWPLTECSPAGLLQAPATTLGRCRSLIVMQRRRPVYFCGLMLRRW